MKFLSSKQVNQAIQRAASYNEKSFIIIQLLAKTGVRVKELISIFIKDILFDEKQIIIRGKGNKIRNIDVSDDILMHLKLYIKNNKLKQNDLLINLTQQRVGQITHQLADINPHGFRHTYAINLLRTTGNNIEYVRRQLGHSTLATTQIYLRYAIYENEKQKLGEMYS